MLGRQMQIKLIQDTQNSLIHEIFYRFGMIVEGRNRGENNRAHAREPEHIFNVDVAQRSFANHQNQLATLFQDYVGGAVNQRVTVSLRDGRKRPHAAGANHHSVSDERTAGDGGGLIL